MNRLVLKVKVASDIHRYTFTERPSFEELCNVIVPKDNRFTYTIKYIDDEQDLISLTNERELEEAWMFGLNLKPSILRITLIPKSKRVSFERSKPCHNAICDICNNRIIGIRHKCLECPDYDLCEQCISKKDSEHVAGHGFTIVAPPQRQWGCCPRRRSWTIICDGCNKTIEKDGFRCQNCPNYDLCSECHLKKTELHDCAHEFQPHRRRWMNHWRMRTIAEKKEDKAAQTSTDSQTPEVASPQIQNQEEAPEEIKIETVQPEVQQEPVAAPEVKQEPVVVEEVKVVKEEVEQQPKSEESEQEPEPLRELLKMLEDMGFGNREVNKFLLVSNSYDVPKTIHQLLSQ